MKINVIKTIEITPGTPHEYHGETSGRCKRCKIRFIWKGKPRLKNALCPHCGRSLIQTTWLWKGQTERIIKEG